jgi:hypothetical protein
MASRGGARPGAGRRKGKLSQAKRHLSEIAKDHAEAAMQVLFDIATGGESEAARVSAANAILDRGYGKPHQAVQMTGPEGGPLKVELIRRVIVDPGNPDT